MFSSGSNMTKLKTSLKLTINRLKLLEKKKTEMALKSRKEIADYIQIGKPERAKIRVEHIIREDYLVEAMEIVEMYCDLLLARFGLIEQMKNLDDGLAEAISSLIWVSPRLQADVQELKTVSDQLVAKYGKPYGLACRENSVGTVSEKLMHKMSVQAPPKLTVEKYIIEIAKYYNVEYEPDPQVMGQDETYGVDALADLGPAPPLIDKNDLDNNRGPGGPGAGSGGGGGGGFTQQPFAYPPPIAGPVPPAYQGYPGYPPQGAAAGPPYPNPPAMNNQQPSIDEKTPPVRPASDGPPPYSGIDPAASAPPAASINASSNETQNTNPAKSLPIDNNLDLPELPTVPSGTPSHDPSPDTKGGDNDDDIDFDDLTRRFEALKKKK